MSLNSQMNKNESDTLHTEPRHTSIKCHFLYASLIFNEQVAL